MSVETTDWTAISNELDEVGCALTTELLTRVETEELIALYPDDEAFRSTVDMARYRFGAGQYRYLAHPLPTVVDELRHALYPRLLPIARDWWTRLGRPAPWPDEFDDWLAVCHAAGQTKPTPLILSYGEGDWNALHRDLYGDLVFPLQVVINLTTPEVDHTGGEFVLMEQRPRAVPGHRSHTAARSGTRVHHPRPTGPQRARLVGRPDPPRSLPRPQRPPPRPRHPLPRRRLNDRLSSPQPARGDNAASVAAHRAGTG